MEINSPLARAQPVSLHALTPVTVSTSYRVLVSVQGGLHQGAAFIADTAQSVYLGSSPDCDLVLMDDGVQDKVLRLYEQDGQLAADVLAAGASAGGVTLPLGVKVFPEPVARLQVGGAALRVELLRRTQRDPVVGPVSATELPVSRQAAPSRGNWRALTLAGLFIATALAVVGGAVNASARRVAQQEEARTLSSVIESFNAMGAQLVASADPNGSPQVRGLIPNAPMREQIERDIRAAGIRAEIQLHDIRQMGESLTRLALLSGHECEARHLGGGRFECDQPVADQAAVSQLRALAQQVPGVVVLNVQARAPEPVLAQMPISTPSLPPPAVAPARPKLPVIRHVAIGERESFAYDGNGRKLRVGDSVDGVKVIGIRFEGVEFMREKQRYQVGVTPMLTSAHSGITN